MRSAVAAPLLLAAVAIGCAQPGSPPGGEVDRSPPRVVEVTPEPFSTTSDLRDPVVIRFNERISERLEGVREWQDAVVVSPTTSPVNVKAGRRRVEVSLVRGWEPDQVYRITIRPVFRDLFNNRRVEPIEVVFSTGAPIPEAALAGFVDNRLTGAAVPDARVEAVRRLDQVTYVALTDTAGFFSMRYLPAGAYDVRAWLDQDRNREMAAFEIQDSGNVAFGVRDTAVVELSLLRPDTTPARLARAEAIDSSKVRLVFDDYFPPGPVDGEAYVYTIPDSTLVGEALLFHSTRLDSLRSAEADAQARREGDPPVADSAPPPLDEQARAEEAAREQPGRGPKAQPGKRPERPPLPSQELILVAPGLLRPDSAYYVRVEGVTNINGLPGGGGSARFIMPPRPPADTVPADTVPGDPGLGDPGAPDPVAPDTLSGGILREAPPDTVPAARHERRGRR